ncbi:hypothetical protein EJ08DRAFT_188826 [Tothia fuscella]|uniref:Uncharacterized protein n=1 Tax=Tothia fuscella TaxID=1048955 RepID=A0A9P4U003_9PEZI|nr:hypothetical protein EJ08DRAFT_188826 [Tothia fuscella]
MAGYPYNSPPGYGAYYAPPPQFSQETPPQNQNYYNSQNQMPAYNPFQAAPQPPTPQQLDMSAHMQNMHNPPPLDANQLAYFWNQVNSGSIPPFTPNTPAHQGFGFGAPEAPLPMSNPFTITHQNPFAPSLPSPVQNPLYGNNSAQYQRVEEMTRSEREDGELSSEGDGPAKVAAGGKQMRSGKKNKQPSNMQGQYNIPSSAVTSSPNAALPNKPPPRVQPIPKKQKARPQQIQAPHSAPVATKVTQPPGSTMPVIPTPSLNPQHAAIPQPTIVAVQQGQKRATVLANRTQARNAIINLRMLGFQDSQLLHELGLGDDSDSRRLLIELADDPIATTQAVHSALNERPKLQSLLNDAEINLGTGQPKPTGMRCQVSGQPTQSTNSQSADRASAATAPIPGLNGISTTAASNITEPAQAQSSELPASKEAQRKLFLDRLAAAKSKKTAAGTKSPIADATPPAPSTAVPTNKVEAVFKAPGLATSASQQPLPPKPPVTVPKRDAPTIRLTPAELSRRMDAMRQQAAQSAKARPILPSRSISLSSIDYSGPQDSDASDSMQSISEAAAVGSGSDRQRGFQGADTQGTSVALSAIKPAPAPIPGLSMAAPSPQAPPRTTSSHFPTLPTQAVPGTNVSNPSQGVSSGQSLRQPTQQHSPIKPPEFTSDIQQPANALKRPASSTAAAIRFGPAKRPFNSRPYENPVIIDISSDEENEEMDGPGNGFQQFSRSVPTGQYRGPPKPSTAGAFSRPNFPGWVPPPQGYMISNSGFATPPVAQTPNRNEIQKQHDALEQKRKELREQIQRKEQERKQLKTVAAPSSGASTPFISKPNIPGSPNHRADAIPAQPARSQDQKIIADRTSSSPMPSDVADRRRKLDSQNARVLKLQKQMEELQAQIRLETEQSEALARELEENGIDTAGMTQEDMQEAKEELVQATEAIPVFETTGSTNGGEEAGVDADVIVDDDEEEEGELIEDSADAFEETSHAHPDVTQDAPLAKEDADVDETAEFDESTSEEDEHVAQPDADINMDMDSSSSSGADESSSGSDSEAEDYDPENARIEASGDVEMVDSSSSSSPSELMEEEREEEPQSHIDTGFQNESSDNDRDSEDSEDDPNDSDDDSGVEELDTGAVLQPEQVLSDSEEEEDDIDLSDIYDPPEPAANTALEQDSTTMNADFEFEYGNSDDEDIYEPPADSPPRAEATTATTTTDSSVPTVNQLVLPGISGGSQLDNVTPPQIEACSDRDEGEILSDDGLTSLGKRSPDHAHFSGAEDTLQQENHIDVGSDSGVVKQEHAAQSQGTSAGPDDSAEVREPANVASAQVNSVPVEQLQQDEDMDDRDSLFESLPDEDVNDLSPPPEAAQLLAGVSASSSKDVPVSSNINKDAVPTARLPVTIIDDMAPELQVMSTAEANTTSLPT